jgi:hypothetical protein
MMSILHILVALNIRTRACRLRYLIIASNMGYATMLCIMVHTGFVAFPFNKIGPSLKFIPDLLCLGPE